MWKRRALLSSKPPDHSRITTCHLHIAHHILLLVASERPSNRQTFEVATEKLRQCIKIAFSSRKNYHRLFNTVQYKVTIQCRRPACRPVIFTVPTVSCCCRRWINFGIPMLTYCMQVHYFLSQYLEDYPSPQEISVQLGAYCEELNTLKRILRD